MEGSITWPGSPGLDTSGREDAPVEVDVLVEPFGDCIFDETPSLKLVAVTSVLNR
jgi:hypothetical protein